MDLTHGVYLYHGIFVGACVDKPAFFIAGHPAGSMRKSKYPSVMGIERPPQVGEPPRIDALVFCAFVNTVFLVVDIRPFDQPKASDDERPGRG